MRTLVFLLGFGLVLGCQADTKSIKEAEKLLAKMNVKAAFERSNNQMLELQLEQSPWMAPYRGVVAKFFDKHMSYESLRPEIVKMYSEAYTLDELKGLNAFYSSDVGKKTIKVMPRLIARAAQIGTVKVQANLDELKSMIKAESIRLQKKAK